MMTPAARGDTELPLPDFYTPENASRWDYRPDSSQVFERAVAWRDPLGLPAADEDRVHATLLLIDVQKDFCFPEGSLYVGGRSGRGALDDNRRTAEFIYRNLGIITEISATMDTHFPYQIFFPSFWLTREGTPPPAHRQVTAQEVRAGLLRPHPALAKWLANGDYRWLREQAAFYCEELERTGRDALYLWPPHCLLGCEGHELVGVLQEARLFHAFARLSTDWIEIKGSHPLTEHYSALSPEVTATHDGGRICEPNTEFVDRLLRADILIIAGQAASHCVRYTLEDLLRKMRSRRPIWTGKVYFLIDCTSSVVVPNPDDPGTPLVDFTQRTEETLDRFSTAGVHLVRSTDPVSEWPDLSL